MAYQAFRDEYFQMPPVTRAYTTACVLTTVGVVSEKLSKILIIAHRLVDVS